MYQYTEIKGLGSLPHEDLRVETSRELYKKGKCLLFSFCIFDPLLDQEEINTMDVLFAKNHLVDDGTIL
jgi:hypothetical protein